MKTGTYQFNTYITNLYNGRKKLGLNRGKYGENNVQLLSEYIKAKTGREREKIREKIILTNMPLAHEIMHKKLNINIAMHDSVDILQDINLYLIESTDQVLSRILKEKVGNPAEYFSRGLYYCLLGKLRKLFRNYYEYESNREYIIDPDEMLMEEERGRIEEEDDKIFVDSFTRYVLGDREKRMIEYYFLEEWETSEIGERYGLTVTRIQQILQKSVRAMRDYYDRRMESLEEKINFRKEIFKTLKRNPGIKYVIISRSPYDIFSLGNPNFDNYFQTLLIDSLLIKGIDPKEWLIVLPEEYITMHPEYRLFNFKYIDIPACYDEPTIYDSQLLTCILKGYPYYKDIKKLTAEVWNGNPRRRALDIRAILYEEEIDEVLGSSYKLMTETDRRNENKVNYMREKMFKGFLNDLAIVRQFWNKKLEEL